MVLSCNDHSVLQFPSPSAQPFPLVYDMLERVSFLTRVSTLILPSFGCLDILERKNICTTLLQAPGPLVTADQLRLVSIAIHSS